MLLEFAFSSYFHSRIINKFENLILVLMFNQNLCFLMLWLWPQYIYKHWMIFDKILEEKVKFGRAQIITLVFLCLVDLNDGAQLVLSNSILKLGSFLTPVIKNAWDLNDNQVSILTSLFYLGTFLGSFLSGKFSDKYGRRPLILLGSFLQILSSTLFFWVNSYEGMCFARFLYGYSFGFSISVTTTMFAEISPLAERGKGILVINFCVSFGKLYGLILAYIFL